MTDGQQVLTSWKEIASYLGKGVRTVQRWEAELELPVHRPGNDRHIVLAFPAELDAWVRPATPEFQPSTSLSAEILSATGKQLDSLRELIALRHHATCSRVALEKARQTRDLVQKMVERARANRERTERLVRQCEQTLNQRRRSKAADAA
jgi:excisionase family DNA binding protein